MKWRRYIVCSLLICFMAIHPGVSAQSYAVMNATSSSGANGIYQADGTFNGKTKYTNGSYTLFNTPGQSMDWAIVPNGTTLSVSDHATSPYSYSTKIEQDTPPNRAWHHGGNTTGLPGESIIVTPLNSIGYSRHYFTESFLDDGTIKDTALVYLFAEGINLTGVDGDDFITEAKASFTGLPAGLTGKLLRTSDTTLLAILEGTALEHSMNENTLIQLSFENSAVSNDDITLMAHTPYEFGILYQSLYFIEGTSSNPAASGKYMLGGMFNEYPYFIKEDYYLCTKSCLPRWIIRSESNVHPLYSTQIETPYPHNRQWHQGGFYYTMGDPLVVGMENTLVYENYSFVESLASDGSYPDSLKIRYYHPGSGSSFSGMANEDFVAEGKILVSNLPEGLSMEVRKFDDSTLFAQLIGAGTAHEPTDNIQNLRLEFKAEAFDGPGIFATNTMNTDTLNVVNMAQYVLVDTTNFPREVNGVYTPYDVINGRTAYIKEGKYYIIFRNMPPDCVWGVMQAGSQNAIFSSGADQDNPPAGGWVKGDYNGTQAATIEIFPVQPWLGYYDLLIEESQDSPGTISDTILILLNQGAELSFSGSISDDFLALGKAELLNLPTGLTASLLKEEDTRMLLLITGNPESHTSADNIHNLTLHFLDDAFSNTDSESLKYSSIYSGKIEYNNITAILANTYDQEVLFYPNPSREFIIIDLESGSVLVGFAIYDTNGKTVLSGVLDQNKMDISSLQPGIYTLHLTTKGSVQSGKLLIY